MDLLFQVDSVDIKRLPDGSSRGFAFVKFMDQARRNRLGASCGEESVTKTLEAKASHMIDNKPLGGETRSRAGLRPFMQAKWLFRCVRWLPACFRGRLRWVAVRPHGGSAYAAAAHAERAREQVAREKVRREVIDGQRGLQVDAEGCFWRDDVPRLKKAYCNCCSWTVEEPSLHKLHGQSLHGRRRFRRKWRQPQQHRTSK